MDDVLQSQVPYKSCRKQLISIATYVHNHKERETKKLVLTKTIKSNSSNTDQSFERVDLMRKHPRARKKMNWNHTGRLQFAVDLRILQYFHKSSNLSSTIGCLATY